MTQDEFGMDLFACIRQIGRVLACQDQYAAVVMTNGRDRITSKLNELNDLKKGIPALIDQLSTVEAAAVVNRYPWVMSL